MMKQEKENLLNIGGVYPLEVTGLTTEGKGVGRIDGMAVFAAGALPGETIQVKILGKKKRYAWGQTMEILTASPQRIRPNCPASAYCGGCQLSHLDYAGQLAAKEGFVREQLSRVGGMTDVDILPIIGAEKQWHYRNRVYLHYDRERGTLGFFQPESRRIAPVLHCCLATANINQIINCLQQHGNRLKSIDGLRHVLIKESNVDGSCLVAFLCEGPYQSDIRKQTDFLWQGDLPLTSLWYNYGKKTPWDGYFFEDFQLLHGEEKLTVSLMDKTYRWGVKDFLQVNFRQTERLYGVAKDMLAQLPIDVQYLWDAYCGIGTIGMSLASPGQTVIGVEVIPEAVTSAKENALANGITGHYFAGLCEEVLPDLLKRQPFASQEAVKKGVVVLDPPRSGCEEVVLAAWAAAGIPYLIYISCHAASLARDVGRLAALGYGLEAVQPVDLFSQTGHVECVVLLSR